MTSIAVQLQPFQQTVEIYESTTYYDGQESADEEMTDFDRQTLVENGFDDQDMYNAEVGSTVVEPPQSDAVRTHAPSTIVDELEYLEEVVYEETDEVSAKVPDIHLVHEPDSYQAEETTAHTPPVESSSSIHPQIFSPASRIIPIPRPSTPIPSHLHITEDGDLDDDWPICLYTPTGQEYVLFRSDGDHEALFEDNWLKSQPLETLFSSIRQALEGELASLTTSFSMDEIILTVPDLDLSIAEDNCYTREISLQDLVNLINGICTKNGTQRRSTCRLQLSLQPRFIARFNQLVSQTAQIWEPSKPRAGAEEDEEQHRQLVEEQTHEDEGSDEEAQEEESPEDENLGEYGYEGEENVEEPQVFNVDTANAEDHFQVVTISDVVEVETPVADALTAAEEDELYEENDVGDDDGVNLQSAESLVDEVDDGTVKDGEEGDEFQEDYHSGEEEVQEHVSRVDIPEEKDLSAQQKDTDDGNADEADLISYEEAADQTEDGQDYRQQYINEQNLEKQSQNDTTNGHVDVVTNNSDAAPRIPDISEPNDPISEGTDIPASPGSPNSKRSFGEMEISAEDQAPPPKRTKS